MRKKASVRRTFYRSFCLLIVLPLVAVAAAGSALLYRKLLADAREMVQMRQEAVSSALTQDVRQASLQLAHFLLSEDSEGLALVDELPASSSRRHETAARLESIFDYYRLTGRRLEALHLYLTDGTSYQLYTGLAVPQNRVKEAAWYRAARQRPGEVCVGVAEPGTLLSGKNRRGDLLLTAALQVEPGYGGSALEVACLYFETDAEEMLESYNSEAGAVRMALALDGAFLAGDEALAPAVERFLGPEGVPGGGMDWGIATQVRNTGLTVVSLVDNRKLMAGYERTLWLCAGAVAAMLGSYALFSVLFLRRIVLPLSTAAIATIGLYYAVFFWNDWFNSLIYLKSDQYPVMMFLRNIVNGTMVIGTGSGSAEKTTIAISVKSAVIITSTVPIIVIYPFLQKFFVKGLTIGGVKG